MSIELMSKAWKLDLSIGEKLLLLKLADHANDEGVCWPGQGSLARLCSMSERAVRDNLRRLQAHGFLTMEYRNIGVDRKTCVYRLHLDEKIAEKLGGGQAENVDSRPAESAGGADSRPADCDIPDRQNLPVVYKAEPSGEAIIRTTGGGGPPLEADSPAQDETGIIWDDQQKIFRNIAKEVFERWDEAFRGLDVDTELAKAELWYDANPKRRKRNVLRFLTNWLARAHQEAKARGVLGNGQRRAV